jgi:hypothetical protein
VEVVCGAGHVGDWSGADAAVSNDVVYVQISDGMNSGSGVELS